MIAENLVQTGMLQFGYFVDGEEISPYLLRLEMLPAYPAVMQHILYLAVQALPAGHYDRLVAHCDAIPLGTALALQTGIPLVYSRGNGEGAAFDLVGAYDVGHPALLVVNSIQSEMSRLVAQCRGVGLEISAILELVSLGKMLEGIPTYSVTSLKALIHELRLNKAVPEKQAEAVLATIE
jgi:hypothetical protein